MKIVNFEWSCESQLLNLKSLNEEVKIQTMNFGRDHMPYHFV